MVAGASSAYKALIQQRYSGYVEEVQQDCSRMTPTSIRFAEQNYDLMLELNNQLIEFCQVLYVIDWLQVKYRVQFKIGLIT